MYKKAGIFVIHKCTSIRHAKSAVKLGVDMLVRSFHTHCLDSLHLLTLKHEQSIDGLECAGHPGLFKDVLRGAQMADMRLLCRRGRRRRTDPGKLILNCEEHGILLPPWSTSARSRRKEPQCRLTSFARSTRTDQSVTRRQIPYVASGGIGNGRGLAAAIALGAEGVNCGTLFMATEES